jgi:hypothetical protein
MDDEYFKTKRQEFANHLNTNCSNRNDQDFDDWDQSSLIPPDIKWYCKYTQTAHGERFYACDSCTKILNEFRSWLTGYNPLTSELCTKLYQLSEEVELLREQVREWE